MSLVMNMIVMLNLLISIISETATSVRDLSIEYQFRERADAIASIQMIVPFHWMGRICRSKKEKKEAKKDKKPAPAPARAPAPTPAPKKDIFCGATDFVCPPAGWEKCKGATWPPKADAYCCGNDG